jgi:hypothetical protein
VAESPKTIFGSPSMSGNRREMLSARPDPLFRRRRGSSVHRF